MHTFEEILEEMEKHLADPPDMEKLARMAAMSVYEFRRMFSFVTGMPPGEYLRKRRLSAAAGDLLQGMSVTEAAAKYGYDSPSSFSRAFREYHGVAPAALREAPPPLRMTTRVRAEIRLSGGREVAYTLHEEGAMPLYGIQGLSDQTDTECCEHVWQRFTQEDTAPEGAGDRIYAIYRDAPEGVHCCIGRRMDAYGALCCTVPAGRYICFSMRGTEDSRVNAFYGQTLRDFFASAPYRRRDGYNLEVFPADMSGEDFSWEVWIPIE